MPKFETFKVEDSLRQLLIENVPTPQGSKDFILQEIMGGGKTRFVTWMQSQLGDPIDPSKPDGLRRLSQEGVAQSVSRYLCECLYHCKCERDADGVVTNVEIGDKLTMEEVDAFFGDRFKGQLHKKAREISNDENTAVTEVDGEAVATGDDEDDKGN